MFGTRLKELRKKHKLSMEELADNYNVKFDGKLNKSTISRYENSLQEPMITVVRNLALYFDVTLDYLTATSITEIETLNLLNELATAKFYSIEEQELIDDYRQLNEDGQDYIDRQMSFALSQRDYKKQYSSEIHEKIV